jgi:acetyl-CoA synthetase
MTEATISRKLPNAGRVDVAPNMTDYETTCRTFDWDQAWSRLAGLPHDRGLNIAWEAVGKHVAAGRGKRVAFRFLDRQGRHRHVSYQDLDERTSRFACVLQQLGIGKGDVLFSLSPRIEALYVAALGTLKNRSVFCPLFSAFGPEPVRTRMVKGDARVLVTTPELFRKKQLAELRQQIPTLQYILLSERDSGIEGEGILAIPDLLEQAEPDFEIEPTRPEDLALLHFTSGTTGTPKGVMHVHAAVAWHYLTGRLALDLHDKDVFWCTADPGWVTGTSYGIIAPLTCGVTSIVDEAEFEATRWYQILKQEQVDVWYTAPTAIRMLMKAGPEPMEHLGDYRPRFIGSVGEPLNPEAIRWAVDMWDMPIHDNWWQSETGGVMIANYACMDIKPGSMGRPLPGIEAAIAIRDDSGRLQITNQPGVEGELVLKRGWPSMFRGYLKQPERYQASFQDDWYISGDLAEQDADGYFYFVGRADDVIKSAGHLISPFEVESALVEHEAVVEAAVIGKPDPVSGNLVKAFVVLLPGALPPGTDPAALIKKIHGHARKRLGAAVAPKEIEVVDQLPHTKSGKILRRLLKARELGLPEGDLSTLEAGS